MTDNAAPREPRYVGSWKRLLAFLIDVAILVVVFIPTAIAIYGGGYLGRLGAELSGLLNASGDPAGGAARAIGMLSKPDSALAGALDVRWQIALLVATILLWRLLGATPGKMLIKAKIVNAKTLGRPSTGQLIGRFFAYIVSTIPFFLGFLWIAFDARKQGWHDKLAGTVVIYEEDEDD